MFLYLIDHWDEFPYSEYGGVHAVVAKDRVDAARLLNEYYKNYRYEDILFAVREAESFELSRATEPVIVKSFVT